MSTPSERAADLARAERLRNAAALVEEFAPTNDHRQQRDRTDILRRLGLLIAGLERHDDHAVCRRCQAEFAYDISWFESRNLTSPRHCEDCRRARKQERRHAGAMGVPREN